MEPSIWLWVWIVLAVILCIAEIFTAGFFLLPFGIGAAIAALLEFFYPGSYVLQWIAFIAGSFVILLGLRQFANRITHEPPVKVAGDRLIGKRGTVIEELVEHGTLGRVRVEREEWRADAPGHEPLPVGTAIEVIAVEGTHLVVKPVAGPPDEPA